MIRFRFRRSADPLRPLSPLLPGLPFGQCVAPGSWQTGCVSDRRQRLAQARLYLVCDAQSDEFLAAALRGGVDIVQLRCKAALGRRDPRRRATVRRRLRAPTARCSSSTTGPTWPSPRMPTASTSGRTTRRSRQARALVGPDRLVGLSTHSPEQIDAAADAASTTSASARCTRRRRSRDGRRSASSSSRYAAAHAPAPFFAIGGIDPSNVDAVVDAGAERIAVVRALTESANPSLTASVLAGRAPPCGGIALGQRSRKRGRRGPATATSPPATASPSPRASPGETLGGAQRRRARDADAVRRRRAAVARSRSAWPSRSCSGSSSSSCSSPASSRASAARTRTSSRSSSSRADARVRERHVADALLGGARVPDAARDRRARLLARADPSVERSSGQSSASSVVGAGGYLFFKLVRVLSRLQMPTPPRA